MSNVINVQSGQPVMQNQQVQTANETTAPAALQNVKPSTASKVCRVLGAIFSFGISEGIRAIANHIEAKAASKARGAGEALPEAEPSVTQRNATLSGQFKNDSLPPELKAAVAEAFSELRASYGDKALPEGSTVQEFLANATVQRGFREKDVINEVANAIKNSQTEISPQDLKNCILEKASPKLASLAAHACILEQAENKLPADRVVTILSILSKTAGFEEELAGCKNAEEVKNCLLNHPKFADTVEYFVGYCECENKTDQYITAELAKLTGKSEQEIQSLLDLNDVKTKYTYASADTTGTAKERLEQLNAKFHDIAAKFIQMKTDLYTSIEPLTVSEGLKEQLRNDVLNESTLKKGYVFFRAEQAVSQVNVSSLIRVLQEGNAVSDVDLTGMLKAVSVQLSDAIVKQYTQAELADLGGDGNAVTMATACQILLDKNPEIVALLKQEPGKIDRLIDMLAEQKADNDEQLGGEDGFGNDATRLNAGAIYGSNFILNTVQDIIGANSSVVSSLQAGTGEGRFAQIMHDTLAAINAEYGINIGTNLNEVAGLPFGKDVIDNIKNRIAAQNQLLSSAQFAEIVRSELQAHVANLAAKTAISERCAELGLNTDRIATMLASLKQLYPALQESINRADSKEMIQALFLSCDKYENVLHRESAIAVFSEQSRQNVLARLAPLLNVDAEDVPTTMNLDKLREGFLIAAKDIHDEGDASEDGSVPDIQGRFQRIADRFVQGKSDLIALVNGNELVISPELRANWLNEINTNISLKNQVLLQGAYNVAQRMDGSGLARALRDGLNQSELLGLVKSLSAQIDVYAHQVFTQEQFNAMGSDETGLISRYARDVFWDNNAELKALLMNNEEMMKRIINELEKEFSTVVSQMARAFNVSGPEADTIKQDMAFIVNAQALLGDVFHE